MTWTASLLPDDALPPDSLVGSMLNPEPLKEDGQVFNKADAIKEPPATVEAMPLWRACQDAYYSVTQHPDVLSEECERLTIAAEIEALRDWLPDMPPQEFIDQWCREYGDMDYTKVRRTMDWLRALLTEQARIARGADHPSLSSIPSPGS